MQTPPGQSSLPSPIAGRSAAAARGQVEIDWEAVFGNAPSPCREGDGCFASPSSASASAATRARARDRCVAERRTAANVDVGARRPVTRAPSGSASAIVADVASGYHILKVSGYSRTKGTPTGELIKSRPFTVGGHRWYIQYYPNGNTSECADYISLFLYLDESVAKAVKAQFLFRFIDDVENQTQQLTAESVRSFESNRGWGHTRFIERESLEKSKHLKDDSFVLRCDIAVVNELRTEELALAEAEAPSSTFVSVPSSDIHRHLGDLLQTEKGADVLFEVSGETFKAHRCVLAARSPVFSAELFGQMKESDATAGVVVHIDDMEAHVFKALLFFIYTDSLPEVSKEDQTAMSQHLLVAADRYGLERLKLICEHKLCSCIEVTTLATILALAEQHHCHGLKKACFSFLSSPANLAAALASDGFEHLNTSCPSVIKELIAKLGT